MLAPPAFGQAPETVFLEELTWTELRDAIRGRQDDDHRADRRHRAERAAHGARQAQRAGAGALRDDRARSRQRAGGAGRRLRSRRRPRAADRAHALSGHDHRPGGRPSQACSSTRRAASGRTASATSCSSATTAATSGQKAVARRLNREWAATRGRVHAIEEYYRAAADRLRAGAAGRAAIGDDEIGTHAGLADTALMLAVDPRLVRTDRLRPAADAERRRSDRRSAPRKRRAGPARRGRDRGADAWPPSGRPSPGAEVSAFSRTLTAEICAAAVCIIVYARRCLSSLALCALACCAGRPRAGPGHTPCRACRRWRIPPTSTARPRRQDEPRRSPATCRASTCPIGSRTTSTSSTPRRSRSSTSSGSGSTRSTSCPRGT